MSKDFHDVLKEQEILGVRIDKETTSKVVQRYGFFPYSVWRMQNDKALEEIVDDDLAKNTYLGKMFKNNPEHRVKVKQKGYSSMLAEGLSKFNPALAKRIISYWTDENDVVLDPFSNRGVIAIMAAHLGRKGLVYEIVPSYYEHICKVIERLNKPNNALFKRYYDVKAFLGNANNMSAIETNSVDLVLSSPPYWNIEKYESVDGQLSDYKTYKSFLKAYYECIKEIYRVVKPGKFAIFVVGDFRRPEYSGGKSKLIRFGRHTEVLFEKAGFETWDIGINFLYSTPSVIGVHTAAKMGRLLKSHEYILVFKKG